MEKFPAVADGQPDLLAHHYTEAGEAAPAVEAWQRAGQRALARGAPGAAASHLRRGLDLLMTLPAGRERDEREFHLQLALGQALFVTKGQAAAETAAAFERATLLGERAGDPAETALLLLGAWTSLLTRDGPVAARRLADQMLAAAERAGLPLARMVAHFAQGVTRYHLADLPGAREHCARALALCEEVTFPLAPIDPMVAGLGYAALPAWQLGLSDVARSYAREALARAERGKRPADRAWAQARAAWLHVLLREPAAAQRHAEQTLATCAEEPNPFQEAMATAIHGWTLAEQGRVDEGIAMLREGLDRLVTSGQRLGLENRLGMLADAHARAGNVAEALRVLAEAEGAVAGEEVYRADTLRRRAELLARHGGESRLVRATFEEALAIARRQGAKALELRAATGLARWLRDHARADEASDIVGSVYEVFTQGFDTRDLVEARALLEESKATER